MKSRTHQLAFALFASVNIHLHSLDDSVVFGEIFALVHWQTVGFDRVGRQQPNVAKVGKGEASHVEESASLQSYINSWRSSRARMVLLASGASVLHLGNYGTARAKLKELEVK